MHSVGLPVVRWVILRRNPGSIPDEPLAVFDEPTVAQRLCDELGPGHDVQPADAPAPADVRVVQTWVCRATLRAGQTADIAEPEMLHGASRLVLADDPPPWQERVVRDEEAEQLEAMAGSETRYLRAYGYTAERARELAKEEAERLISEG